MNYCFDTRTRHRVVDGNKNVYISPALHPKRCMAYHDFIYILDGKWEIGLNDEMFTVKKDDVIILPANIIHYGIAPCKENTQTLFFHVDTADGDGKIGGNAIPSSISPTKCCLPTVIKTTENGLIKNYFFQIISAISRNCSFEASVYFDLLILSLKEVLQSYKGYNIAETIKKFIDYNIYESITNTSIAESLNISIRTAEKKFKEKYNTTIHQYILNKKMRIAKNYIENYPDMKLCEIASVLRFYDEYHFSRQYKKHFTVAPSTHKKSVNKVENINCIN